MVGYYTYIGSYSNVPKWYISNLPESKYGDFDILYTYFNAGGSVYHINFYYISQKNNNNFPFAQTTMHFYFFIKQDDAIKSTGSGVRMVYGKWDSNR